METETIREKFLKILGNSYKKFGFPAILGWIEALLCLEKKELMQGEISIQLTNIFKDQNVATSISSVNRALKIMEFYKIVVKKGNPKIGYSYKINMDSNFIIKFFYNLIEMTKNVTKNLTDLKELAIKKDDQPLIVALNLQTDYMTNMCDIITKSIRLSQNDKL